MSPWEAMADLDRRIHQARSAFMSENNDQDVSEALRDPARVALALSILEGGPVRRIVQNEDLLNRILSCHGVHSDRAAGLLARRAKATASELEDTTQPGGQLPTPPPGATTDAWEHLRNLIAAREQLYTHLRSTPREALDAAFARGGPAAQGLGLLEDLPTEWSIAYLPKLLEMATWYNDVGGRTIELLTRTSSIHTHQALIDFLPTFLQQVDPDYADYRQICQLSLRLEEWQLLEEILSEMQGIQDADVQEVREEFQEKITSRRRDQFSVGPVTATKE